MLIVRLLITLLHTIFVESLSIPKYFVSYGHSQYSTLHYIVKSILDPDDNLWMNN